MPAAGLLFVLLLQVAGGAAPLGASISGRVSDRASARPLGRIVVTLYSADRARQAETLTDKDGRYEFGGLKAGKYTVSADNDDHVSTYLPEWFGGDEPANIELVPDEPRTNVDIFLARALAVEGHVFDAQGEPLRDVSVSATHADGRTPGAYTAITDDLGSYRVFGLRTGQYRICAAVLNGTRIAPAADGTPLARTCYPDFAVMAQDSFNIDIHMQPRDPLSGATPDAAEPWTDPTVTGIIRGVVVDNESGRPLPRASVHLGFEGPSQPAHDLSTGTNGDGVFTFAGLKPGAYDGFAMAAGHDLASLKDSANSRLLTVEKGKTLQVSVRLPRTHAIAVRLSDAYDIPVSRVGVSVRSLDDGPMPFRLEQTSDDLGRIRVSGLPPGRYIVCAEPGEYAASPRAGPQPKRARLLRTCYPSATDETNARPVTIANGDLEDLEISMARGHTVSISGTIVTSAGAPAGLADVELKNFTRTATTSTWLTADGAGKFRVLNLQPGTYAIDAALGDDAAFVPVRVDDDDVENVLVAMRNTVTVTGRVIGDDPSAPPPTSTPRRVPLILTARLVDDRLPRDGSSRIATANSDGTFSISGLFGRRTINVLNPPTGWYVKAIRYGGKDVTDAAVDVKDDYRPLEIVLSTQGATLSGAIADVTDKRGMRAEVCLFRVPERDSDVPRLVDCASVTDTYSFGPIREGNYSIVAIPANSPVPKPGDWDLAARLAALGERVTVTNQEQRTLDLRVAAIR